MAKEVPFSMAPNSRMVGKQSCGRPKICVVKKLTWPEVHQQMPVLRNGAIQCSNGSSRAVNSIRSLWRLVKDGAAQSFGKLVRTPICRTSSSRLCKRLQGPRSICTDGHLRRYSSLAKRGGCIVYPERLGIGAKLTAH